MASILNKFEICAQMPNEIKVSVKLFHVFRHDNVILVTEQDKVYCIGHNDWGTLGLGHGDPVEEYTEIKELSAQNIMDFFSGESHILGRNEENVLFNWGRNTHAQLGRGYISGEEECLTPDKIEFFKDETIEDISCGTDHTLVLLSNGLLYGWGDNCEGQLGLLKELNIIKPTKVIINEKNATRFKYINCNNWSSHGITSNGLLYSWGYCITGDVRHEDYHERSLPRLINLFNVQKTSLLSDNVYYLTNDGTVYFCGINFKNEFQFIQNTPKKIKGPEQKILDFPKMSENNFEAFCFNRDNKFYKFHFDSLEMIEDMYECHYDFYAQTLGITPQTVQISSDGQINNSYLNKSLQHISLIGSGSYGTVRKYLNVLDKQFYAVKTINISDFPDFFTNDIQSEVQTMAKLSNNFIVQYNNSWINDKHLYIQMEFCFNNLQNILSLKPICFERDQNQAINSIEYYISCKIFRQITEALNYLHSLKPKALIHTNLKPNNILIVEYKNTIICKLADLGLVKLIEKSKATHFRTTRYMAPKDDHNVDIWSLGVIGLELFNLYEEGLNLVELYKGSIFAKQILLCKMTIENKLRIHDQSQRMTSIQLLKEIDGWLLDRTKIEIPLLESYIRNFQENNMVYFYRMLTSI